jgi:hypothetical protein
VGPGENGREYAFLAVDQGGVRRSVVLFRERVMVALDLAEGDAEWQGPKQAVTALERRGHGETLLLHVIAQTPARFIAQDTISLVGVRFAERLVMFHAERFSARSPVWFDAEGAANMKCLITGLAPGGWEIWRELYLEDPNGLVRREEGALYLEGPPGRYYLKRQYD